MSENELNQQDNTGHEKNHHIPRPYWKRPHIQWAFWIGVGLLKGTERRPHLERPVVAVNS